MLPGLRLFTPFRTTSLASVSLFSIAAMSTTATHSSAPSKWEIRSYQCPHSSWPYRNQDFDRQDPTSDHDFYSSPRFVTHIDDAAIDSLRSYYDQVLPQKGKILDFCSSWISHYPQRLQAALKRGDLRAIGMGMNQRELAANADLTAGRILQDLNSDPTISATVCDGECLDASTCVVSIDYLIKPVEVLTSLRERTKPGGSVHLIISNRCFPTKAVRRWLKITEEQRLDMVGDYLHFAGWRNIEIVDLESFESENESAVQQPAQGLRAVMTMMGMGGNDPLWAVRAIK